MLDLAAPGCSNSKPSHRPRRQDQAKPQAGVFWRRIPRTNTHAVTTAAIEYDFGHALSGFLVLMDRVTLDPGAMGQATDTVNIRLLPRACRA